MKGVSALFPGAPLSPALCDNPVFMPEGLDGHHDASAQAPPLSNYELFFVLHAYSVDNSVHFVLFFFTLFYTPYVHFGQDAKDCLESWKLMEKKEVIVGWKKEKKCFSLYRFLIWTYIETRFDESYIIKKRSYSVCISGLLYLWVSSSYYITVNWNGGNFSAKLPAVQWNTARSVCPKARPEQQLLITEVQAKRALHSHGVHWDLDKPPPIHLENMPHQQYL